MTERNSEVISDISLPDVDLDENKKKKKKNSTTIFHRSPSIMAAKVSSRAE